MSVREREEQRQKSCPSRGLGLAAAAIGVGVGAALYYIFNKRAEHPVPDTDGATTSGWTCEEALSKCRRSNDSSASSSSSSDSDDDTTVSEHSTTNTSVQNDHTDDADDEDSFDTISSEESSEYSDEQYLDFLESPVYGEIELDTDFTFTDTSSSSNMELTEYTPTTTPNCSNEQYLDSQESPVDWEAELDQDWDVTNSSLYVPRASVRNTTPSPLRRLVMLINNAVSPRNPRQQVRKRSWSLEECSICCEVMLKDQPLRQLACSHNFHAACVEPWLDEQQTCPNCRKLA